MDHSPQLPPAPAAAPAENSPSPGELCQALMLGLGPRRYAIVRRGAPTGLRSSLPLRRRVRDLRPGDEVIYKGQRVIVRSIAIYE